MDRRSSLGCLLEIVETLVLTLVIFFVIQNFIAQPYQVQQNSMERTLEPGQYVLVDKLTPRWDDYSRGDVVVFDPPETWTSDPTPFIKRVIGLPGDTVQVKVDGRVYVNGVGLDEPYTYRNDAGINEPTEASPDQATWTVPAGQLFVMGDHRRKSADSRVFGPISISNVIGRAFLRYWPVGTFGILQTPSYPDIPAAPLTAGPRAVTPVFVLLAALVVAGAVAAVAAGSPRLAVLGLLVALVWSAYVAEPFPGPAGLIARLAGTTLGVFLVWIMLRDAPTDMPASANGWLGSAAIAIAAVAAGWLAAGTLGTSLAGGSPNGPGIGGLASALIGGSLVPRAATGAAFALAALAVPQIALARDALRLGVALMLLIAAAGLLANAFIGSLTDVEELGIALLTAFAGAGTAAVIAASLRRGGDLELRDSLRPDAAVRHRSADDAHRGQVD